MHRTHTPKNADQVARKAPSVEEVRRLLARYRRSTVTQTPSRSSQLRRPPTRRVQAGSIFEIAQSVRAALESLAAVARGDRAA